MCGRKTGGNFLLFFLAFCKIILHANSDSFDFDQCLLSDNVAELKFNDDNNTLKYIEYNLSNRQLKKSYDAAVEVCKFCYGGHLVTDITQIPERYLPIWIGLYRKSGSGSIWQYANGSAVPATILSGNRLSVSLKPHESYGIWGDKTKWRTIEADRNIAEEVAQSREEYSEYEETENTNTYSMQYPIKGIICLHKKREICETVNYTDAKCVYSRRYGCHRYVTTVIYEPDDRSVLEDQNNCTYPKHYKFAEQCPRQNCMCKTTVWSPWSPCTAKTCMDGMGKRNRQRSITNDPPCTSAYVKPKNLAEEEQCYVVGCHSLTNELLEEIDEEAIEQEEENEEYSIFG